MHPSLSRFIHAQEYVSDEGRIYDIALSELHAGKKESHWMWFIFPQLRGLGSSPNAVRYAIADIDEARLYLHDVTLGTRLVECVRAVLAHGSVPLRSIFSPVDSQKFVSSMTLFDAACAAPGAFEEALQTFNSGHRDNNTLRMLNVAKHL